MTIPLLSAFMRTESRISAVILTLSVMLMLMGCLVVAWRFDRVKKRESALEKREQAFNEVESSRERVNRILFTATERLALIKSRGRANASILDAKLDKLELVLAIWECGTYEPEINALDGPRAADLAYLMLSELGFETPEHIQAFYEMANNELGDEAFSQEAKDIREFVVRALAPRTAVDPIALE